MVYVERTVVHKRITMMCVEITAVKVGTFHFITICDAWYCIPVAYHVHTVSCSHIATYYVPLYSTYNMYETIKLLEKVH